jgi:hypothetical protein
MWWLFNQDQNTNENVKLNTMELEYHDVYVYIQHNHISCWPNILYQAIKLFEFIKIYLWKHDRKINPWK